MRQTLRLITGLTLVAVLPALLHGGLLWLGLPAIARYLTISAASIQTAIYLSLLVVFGMSLLPGHVPLITRIATATRGPLPPELTAYTRHVTMAWAYFCLAQLVVSGLLLAFAPREEWALFITLNLPFLALMFVAEYLTRITRFRHVRHESLADMLRVARTLRQSLRQP